MAEFSKAFAVERLSSRAENSPGDNNPTEPKLRIVTASEAQSEATALRILSCQADRGGNAHVRHTGGAGLAVEYEFIDEFNNIHSATAARVERRHLRNLVERPDSCPDWIFKPLCASFSGGINLSPEWSLPGVSTTFLVSGERPDSAQHGTTGTAGLAVLASPAGEEVFALSPNARYRLSLLAAAHRCAGRVRVELLQRTGVAIRLASRRIARAATGGTQETDYDNIVVEFVVPEGGSIRIFVEKGHTESGPDSYLFLARPSLEQAGAASSPNNAADAGETRFEICESVVVPPPSLLKAGGIDVVLRLRAGNQVIDHPIHLSINPGIEVAAALAPGMIRLEGQCANPGSVTLAAYVDGQPSATGEFHVSDGRFSGTLPLDHRHLDGRAHQIELRSAREHALLAGWTDILPAHLTPWDALQTYARMPLTASNAPAAPHHFRSFRRWMWQAENRPTKRLPPLVRLHNTLLEGFQQRRRYEPFDFPVHEATRVSVVVPVHNKFEVTYFCLSALLFAHNRTPFEVIVVDDGSTDKTLALKEIVGGVRVVRHERAQGFVGACNAGAEIARGEFIAFLNNDTEVTAGWLDELVETFDNFTDVGLTGSKLVYPDGRLQEAGGIVWRTGNPWNVGRGGNPEDPPFNYLRQVDYLSGAAILLRRETFDRLGQFSRDFAPAYFEDTDLAMKVRQDGQRVVYVPTSVVYHYEGQSAGTDSTSGMKRFQEVNRPKFKRKWSHIYNRNGEEGVRPDREKDRNTAFRVLFIDHQVPLTDQDAGSYAAFQEIRLLQGLGGKVTFLPRNLAWLDRHTLALQRIGVECLYAPYVLDFAEYLARHASDYDLVYVCRYSLAQEVIPLVRGHSTAKIAFNVADLHFLRELREAASGNPKFSHESATATRQLELEQAAGADLTLSYSDVEIAVLQSHLGQRCRTAKLPWVLEVPEKPLGSFETTRDALFLGSFGHPPNVRAVQFFARQILPRLRDRLPEFKLRIAGGQLVDEVRELESEAVEILGYVAELDDVFRTTRVFVAPLLAGAGIKGKVLEAAARGVPSVLSRIATEGTELTDGIHCLVAETADAWVDAVTRLNSDKDLWNRLAVQSQEKARASYSFERGLDLMAEALASLEIYGRRDSTLVYRHVRPHKYGLD